MKERPILFSAPMVCALLAGTKTQTRRVVKPQPHIVEEGGSVVGVHTPDDQRHGRLGKMLYCPYGRPGDRLWVRETFARIDGQQQPWIETDYRATYTHGDRLGDSLGIKKRWSPSIHMPRHASRITLEVTGVRLERLQDISASDARAEGIGRNQCPDWHAVADYRELWSQINGRGSWDANPWVWVVEFKRIAG